MVTTNRWIVIIFGSHFHVPLQMNYNLFSGQLKIKKNVSNILVYLCFLKFLLPCDGAAGVSFSFSIVTGTSLTSEGAGSETSGGAGSDGGAARVSVGADSGSDTITVCWTLVFSEGEETSEAERGRVRGGRIKKVEG